MRLVKIVFVYTLLLGVIVSCNSDESLEIQNASNLSLERDGELANDEDFFNEKIEVSDNGEFKIFGESALRVSWEKDLKDKGLNVKLAGFVVKETNNLKNEDSSSLLLIATSEDGLTKIAMRMKERTDIPPFETSTSVFAIFGERVVCTGACDSGCQPYIIGEKPDGSVLEDDEYLVDEIGCSFCIPPLGNLPSCERIVIPRQKF